jgi:hypothetical protein
MEITLIVNRYSHGQQNHLPKLIKPFFSVGRRLESSVRTAYAYHHGTFDYNRMSIAPMGCSVQFHFKPNRRKTFGEHSGNGFYLKMSAEHYRTHVVFCKKTRAKRVADTVFFKQKYITQPRVTPADAIVNAFTKLRDAIQGIQHSKDDAHFEALRRLEQTLQPQNKQIIKMG